MSEADRERPPFDRDDYEDDDMFDADDIDMERKTDIRQCAAKLLMVERANEWLLEDET